MRRWFSGLQRRKDQHPEELNAPVVPTVDTGTAATTPAPLERASELAGLDEQPTVASSLQSSASAAKGTPVVFDMPDAPTAADAPPVVEVTPEAAQQLETGLAIEIIPDPALVADSLGERAPNPATIVATSEPAGTPETPNAVLPAFTQDPVVLFEVNPPSVPSELLSPGDSGEDGPAPEPAPVLAFAREAPEPQLQSGAETVGIVTFVNTEDAGSLNRMAANTQTPADVILLAREAGVRMVDVKFADVPGTWQHFSIPVRLLDEGLFREGVGFDGSSIRGFQQINESDMLLLPDPTTAFLDPFSAVPTLSLICDVAQPGASRMPYSRDPRYIARKAEAYLKSTGIADTAYFGPEAEFFVFDSVAYSATQNHQLAVVESSEAHWSSATPGLGHLVRSKEGYFPTAPTDSLQDLRTQMVLNLEQVGIAVEAQHHEVATAGQCEIDLRFDSLLKMADTLMTYKYIIKNTARAAGKTATFMPKPIYGDNGSGMHVHQSLWQGERPLFADAEGYAGLSKTARHYIGGLLTHAPALLALAAPTTNSYRRLVPGFEAPVNLVFSQRNRSAAVRIPMYSESPKAKRIEFRPPDPTCNPYLTFAALLLAGLDGIERGIEPEAHGFGPLDRNIYELSAAEKAEIASVPGTLDEALDALERDHRFLLAGDVFTRDLLEEYVALKRVQAAEVRLRPAPLEFALYYDA